MVNSSCDSRAITRGTSKLKPPFTIYHSPFTIHYSPAMTTAPITVRAPRAASEQPTRQEPAAAKISVRDLNFYYGRSQALHRISLDVPERVVMAFIGPSGCGKSTFLRTLNRMNDTIPGTRAVNQDLALGAGPQEPGLHRSPPSQQH